MAIDILVQTIELLIATTLVAVVLGLIVWRRQIATKIPFEPH